MEAFTKYQALPPSKYKSVFLEKLFYALEVRAITDIISYSNLRSFSNLDKSIFSDFELGR